MALAVDFFDSIGQIRTSATQPKYVRFAPESRPIERAIRRSEKGHFQT
jgi:hypothetical protein